MDFFQRNREEAGANSSNIRNIRDKFFRTRRPLEEPTFLGFKILFDFPGAFYSPLFNIPEGEDANAQESSVLNQLPNAGGFGIPNGDSGNPRGNLTDSAYTFLEKRGYRQKAEHIKAFVESLQEISLNSEWYVQGITGLETAFNYDFTDNKVRGGNGEEPITITLNETLDMKITNMLGHYYAGLYDIKNRRILLPENLRYFTMHVYIADFRDFVAYDKTLLTGNYQNGFSTNDLLKALGKVDVNTINIPQTVLTFNNCYIEPTGFANMFAELNNSEPTQAEQTLDIRYNGQVEYDMSDLNTNQVISSQSDIANIGEGIRGLSEKAGELAAKSGLFNGNEVANQLATLGNRLAGQGLGAINNEIEKLRGELRSQVLGNVYTGTLARTVQESLLNAAARSINPNVDL